MVSIAKDISCVKKTKDVKHQISGNCIYIKICIFVMQL